MISKRINDPGIIAACHCGDEYETDYSESIDTHPVTSIDSAHRKSTDIEGDKSVDTCPDEWENDYYNPTIDAYSRKKLNTDEYDEDHEEERATEYRAILDEEVKLLHHYSWKRNAPSIDMTSLPSIDTQPQQRCQNWGYEHHHESFAVETATYAPEADKLQDSFTDKELLNMQRRDDTDQIQAEAAWERTCFSQSIDTRPQQSIDTNNTTLIDNRPIPKTIVSEKYKLDNQYLTPDKFGIFRDPDGYAKAIDGRTLHVSREDIADILQTANGADNLFMHQRSNPEQKTTKEFYYTAGIENSFKQRSRHTTHPSIDVDEKDEYGIYRDDREFARDLDRHTIPIHNKDIRRLLERASRDEPAYIRLPEHASSFTQTKLVPEIYTKDEMNEMFYGVCGEHDRNKDAFQMKLDGVYYPLNDSISWLTTCMEEMKQDIARIQNATDTARPPSIDRRRPQSIDSRQSPSIDRHHHTSIDNCSTASIDTNPPRPHTMKSQPDFHTREEIDQFISALTSKVEAIQRELVKIQRYVARRPEASLSIDRRNNKLIDSDTNRGRLVPKMTSDMSNTPYHREEISADTYATLTRHQFNLESLGERLQGIENTTATLKDKWRRGDEAMRDFTDSTKDTKVDQPVNYPLLLRLF
ncbi:hypothetical protein DY000_02055544 [Brassica cretica]|uniref:Uncharacterized protein n=1 Tax=Brassica cretica TaxID=69181 RepID=A0ABQ7A7T7_BRACR|nr:hypothetical protein DY000_02055544 [Brassica cretica]